MSRIAIILLPLIVVGCASPRLATVPAAPKPPQLVAIAPLQTVETCYEVRGYFDRNLRHEPHAVYRRTQVPVNQEAASRSRAPSVNVDPLPPSEELAAELRTQREITANLRAVQARMAEIEQAAKTQYAALVRQTAEISRFRAKIERTDPSSTRFSAPTIPESTDALKP